MGEIKSSSSASVSSLAVNPTTASLDGVKSAAWEFVSYKGKRFALVGVQTQTHTCSAGGACRAAGADESNAPEYGVTAGATAMRQQPHWRQRGAGYPLPWLQPRGAR
jgi:hypothetical protein